MHREPNLTLAFGSVTLSLMHIDATYRRFRHHAGQLAARP